MNMPTSSLSKALRFYFITDDHPSAGDPLQQVTIALEAGATIVQYRDKAITLSDVGTVSRIRSLCKVNRVPFVINDNVLLAKAVDADGVHLGQTDEDPAIAREILGPEAIVGLSASTPAELLNRHVDVCDYVGTGPVFPTTTKADAKGTIGPSGLSAIAARTDLPVVAIGGITPENAGACFSHGAAGVAVISAITRAADPRESALKLASVCGCAPRPELQTPWNDEFRLIDALLKQTPDPKAARGYIKVPPGDDAALLAPLTRPVITTDAQREGVHFRWDWQTPEEVGYKAATVTLSDLAACYATPISLFINLALPPETTTDIVEALYKGVWKALEMYGCSMGGGNVSAGARFAIDLFAVGQGRDSLFPKRSAARPGDGLYVTGPIGLARAGLDALCRDDGSFGKLISCFKSPKARFDAADILADHHVACATDISDGLAGDADHIAEKSGIAIEFDPESLQIDESLAAYCKAHGLSPVEMMLSGGEDYELLFACGQETFQNIQQSLPHAHRVGSCLPFEGRRLLNLPEGLSSFQHGRAK